MLFDCWLFHENCQFQVLWVFEKWKPEVHSSFRKQVPKVVQFQNFQTHNPQPKVIEKTQIAD
jgi:hypothetical protein